MPYITIHSVLNENKKVGNTQAWGCNWCCTAHLRDVRKESRGGMFDDWCTSFVYSLRAAQLQSYPHGDCLILHWCGLPPPLSNMHSHRWQVSKGHLQLTARRAFTSFSQTARAVPWSAWSTPPWSCQAPCQQRGPTCSKSEGRATGPSCKRLAHDQN